jgi:flavin reductase (DIM6/NTAB) family NADH-FMN oxidoreductase RutF
MMITIEQPGPGDERIDPRILRRALGAFPTGVVITTAWESESGWLGMTMNSFTTVSLDPPLVIFSIDRRSVSLPAWLRASGYAINVLARGQELLSNQFARSRGEKWRDVRFTSGLHNAPLLDGTVARFECSRHQVVDGGDHMIFLARVNRATCNEEAEPLVFCRSRYGAVQTRDSAGTPGLFDWPLAIHY